MILTIGELYRHLQSIIQQGDVNVENFVFINGNRKIANINTGGDGRLLILTDEEETQVENMTKVEGEQKPEEDDKDKTTPTSATGSTTAPTEPAKTS